MNFKIVATAVAALVLGGGMAQAETVLRFANFEPPQSVTHTKVFIPWAEHIEKESNGRIKIQFFAGGALGPDPRAQLELVDNRVADIAWVFPYFTPAQFPQTGLAELPMEIVDAPSGTVALNAMYDRGLLSQGLDSLVPLGVFSSPPGVYFMKFAPKSLEDLRGRQSAASGPIRNQIMERLGMKPVGGVNVGNMAESLSRGTIEVGQMNFTAAGTFRVKDVAHNAVRVQGGASMLFVLMNKATFESLPAEDQKVLADGRKMIAELWSEVIGTTEVAAEKTFRSGAGHTVLDLSETERAALKERLSPITSAWVAATPGGQEMLSALREETARAPKPK